MQVLVAGASGWCSLQVLVMMLMEWLQRAVLGTTLYPCPPPVHQVVTVPPELLPQLLQDLLHLAVVTVSGDAGGR